MKPAPVQPKQPGMVRRSALEINHSQLEVESKRQTPSDRSSESSNSSELLERRPRRMARLTASGASSTRLHTAQLTPWKTLPQGRNEHHQKTSQPGARRAVKLYPEPKKHTEGMGTQELSALFGDLEFFKLPPEIRDMIYDLLFGLPEHEFFTFYDGRVVILNENNVRGSYGMTDLFLGYPPAGYLYPPLQRPFRQPAPLRPALPRRNPVAVYAGEAAGRRAPQLPVALLRGNSHLRSEASPALYARNRFVLKPFSVADMMSSSAARYATRYRRAIAISSQLPSAFPQQNLVKLSVVITLSDMSAWMVTGNLSVDCTAIGAFKSIKELRISVTDPQDSDRSAAEVVKDVSLLGVVAGLLQLVGPDTEVVWTDDAPFTNHYEKAVSKDALRTMSWMRAASGVHTNVVPTQP